MIPFPAETVPDGDVFLAHHLVYPLIAALVPTLRVWSRNRTRDPWLVLSGILAALFGFTFGWRQDPTLGALLTGGGLLVGLLALWRDQWDEWPQSQRVAVGLLFLAALDDWVSHALGLPTPLDWAFHVLPLWAVAAVAVALSAVVVVSLRVRFPPATSA